MFEDFALLYTVRNAVGCQYGVPGDSIIFGYVPDPGSGKDFEVSDVASHIDDCLKTVRTSLSDLPEPGKQVALSSAGFTFVRGVKPKGFQRRIDVDDLVESLTGHPQMVTPIMACQVYVFVDGYALNDGYPLSLEEIEPIEGYELPRIVAIPEKLKDPQSRQMVSTTEEGRYPPGSVEIRTSKKNMRYGKGGKRQARHQVTFRTNLSGFIGRVPMGHLDVRSAYRDRMYCSCHLDALDRYQRNDRSALAVSPLTRAVEAWISAQVQEFCEQFEDRESKIRSRQGREELSRMNEFLDHWKNEFLKDLMQGLYGAGEGRGQGRGEPLPSGKPTSMQLSISHSKAGIGVSFRPTLKFLDKKNQRIRPVPYRWVSDDNNIAMVVDEDLMLIQTFAEGRTHIFAEMLDGRLRSNKVPLEVIPIKQVRVSPAELEMELGGRRKLEAICTLYDGTETSDVYLEWMENNPSVVRVSSSGMVYAFALGQTEVTAAADRCKSDCPARITVVEGTGSGEGGKKSKGYPRILLSEVDCAPGEAQPAYFSPDIPPVYQRDEDTDRNIWWINLASPFARLYYDPDPSGIPSQRWRMYHVERVIDIMVQIAIVHGPESSDTLDSRGWIFQASEKEAEIRSKAIDSLLDFIETGSYADNEGA